QRVELQLRRRADGYEPPRPRCAGLRELPTARGRPPLARVPRADHVELRVPRIALPRRARRIPRRPLEACARDSRIDDQPEVHASLELGQAGVLGRRITMGSEMSARVREYLEAAEHGEGQLRAEVVPNRDAQVEAVTEDRIATVACRESQIGTRRRTDRHDI